MEDDRLIEDALAQMRLRTVIHVFRAARPIADAEILYLWMTLDIRSHPGAKRCIDEALSLVAARHDDGANEPTWSLRDTARAWLSEVADDAPGSDDDVFSRSDRIQAALDRADAAQTTPGECTMLWHEMVRRLP